MNDKDRDLITQVLQAAGKAGEQGFAYLVQYTRVDGILSVFGFGLGLAGALVLLRIAFRWKSEDEFQPLVRGVAIVVCCIFSFVMICGIENSVVAAIMPEGAAIHSVLSK